MRTVKLTIEVEVPDEAKYLSVDENGAPWTFMDEPEMNVDIWLCRSDAGKFYGESPSQCLSIKNWRDLKINLMEYFKCPVCGQQRDQMGPGTYCIKERAEACFNCGQYHPSDIITTPDDPASDASDSEL